MNTSHAGVMAWTHKIKNQLRRVCYEAPDDAASLIYVYEVCNLCNGEGERNDWRDPDGFSFRCEKCDGKGEIEMAECDECKYAPVSVMDDDALCAGCFRARLEEMEEV